MEKPKPETKKEEHKPSTKDNVSSKSEKILSDVKRAIEQKIINPNKPVQTLNQIDDSGKYIDEKGKLRQMSLISLWLDGYKDIFSDFDPRPYSQRILSEDFLEEAKRFSKETKKGKVRLSLLVPLDRRNVSKEGNIRKRLREHFKSRYEHFQEKRKSVIMQGVSFIAIGFVVMFLATILHFSAIDKSFLVSFLVVFMEPAGWFLFWEGGNLIIFDSKQFDNDLEFYKKMSNCEIVFSSY